jgi:hypothetical protein
LLSKYAELFEGGTFGEMRRNVRGFVRRVARSVKGTHLKGPGLKPVDFMEPFTAR